jgi:hypothetical protein
MNIMRKTEFNAGISLTHTHCMSSNESAPRMESTNLFLSLLLDHMEKRRTKDPIIKDSNV